MVAEKDPADAGAPRSSINDRHFASADVAGVVDGDATTEQADEPQQEGRPSPDFLDAIRDLAQLASMSSEEYGQSLVRVPSPRGFDFPSLSHPPAGSPRPRWPSPAIPQPS
jgi:hypothetical protein